MNNSADNMWCIVDDAKPQILTIQGVVWFSTEELAYQYYNMLKPEVRELHSDPTAIQEKDLHQIFDMKSSYIKHMKTRTRLSKEENQPGVVVESTNHEPLSPDTDGPKTYEELSHELDQILTGAQKKMDDLIEHFNENNEEDMEIDTVDLDSMWSPIHEYIEDYGN